MLQQLSKRFIARSNVQGYKGKKRDDAAINFFLGAASMLELQGKTEEMNSIILFAALSLAIEGYKAVEKAAINDLLNGVPGKEENVSAS